MNQGKLKVVKQEMARVKVDMLGISKLKWIGIGEFNSDAPLYLLPLAGILYKIWSSHHSHQKNLKCSNWMQFQKKKQKNRMISVCFQGKPFNITVMQGYVQTSNAEEPEVEWFYEDLQNLLELTPKKYIIFIIGDWNAKVGSQRNTWSNRQIWPWSIE